MENLFFFKNVSKEDINKMLKCFEAKEKTYKKGDTILNFIGNFGLVGIIITGEASVVRYDLNGDKLLIEKLNSNSVFGEMFVSYNTDEIEVIADTDTRVIFMNYYHILEKCNNSCFSHNKVLNNLLEIFTNKIIALNERTEILTKKTIRDRLLTYFKICSKRLMSKSFLIPFSYTDLANYLGIDRSAMQRELKNLKEDGLIKTKKRKITLFY